MRSRTDMSYLPVCLFDLAPSIVVIGVKRLIPQTSVPAVVEALVQIAKNKNVEGHKPLIIQYSILGFCLGNGTLHQSWRRKCD